MEVDETPQPQPASPPSYEDAVNSPKEFQHYPPEPPPPYPGTGTETETPAPVRVVRSSRSQELLQDRLNDSRRLSIEVGGDDNAAYCFHCNAYVTPKLHIRPSKTAFATSGGLILVSAMLSPLLMFTGCLPFMIPACYKRKHYCPTCSERLDTVIY